MNSRFKLIFPLLFLLVVIFLKKSGISLNLWLIVFVFLQSSLLFFLIGKKIRDSVQSKLILVALPILIGMFVMGAGIYKDTFKVTNFEKNQLWVRAELYRRELGLLGRSNFGNSTIEQSKLIIDKVNQKITEPYELNHYFSTEDFSFYPLFLLPFFALGFLFMLSENILPTLYYLGLATIGAVLVPPHMTYWLFIPLINLGLLLGVTKIRKLFTRNIK